MTSLYFLSQKCPPLEPRHRKNDEIAEAIRVAFEPFRKINVAALFERGDYQRLAFGVVLDWGSHGARSLRRSDQHKLNFRRVMVPFNDGRAVAFKDSFKLNEIDQTEMTFVATQTRRVAGIQLGGC
jgi:hypothetical protein